MDTRLVKLVELCREEIEATADLVEYGPLYTRYVAEERHVLAIKINADLTPPRWEDPDFWNSCIIKSLGYRLASLKIAHRSAVEKCPAYVSDIEPLAIQIVQSLSQHATA